MKAEAERGAGGWISAAFAALSTLVLASCTATSGPELNASMPAFASPAGAPAGIASVDADRFAAAPATADASETMPAAEDAASGALPAQVAFLPVAKPADEPALDAISTELKRDGEAPLRSDEVVATAAGAPVLPADGQFAEAAQPPSADVAPATRKRGLFSMFESAPAKAVQHASMTSPTTRSSKPIIATAGTSSGKRLIDLSDGGRQETGQRPVVMKASFGDALPGVRQSALFEITRKSGLDDDSDVDVHEDEADTMQVASAGSLARLDPRGLLLQRESVDVACLKPDLLRALKSVEGHFGKKLVVTSGYRSPTYNRQVRGARHSMHMFCAAADVQMPGVSKWELAAYVRSLPGRGGVGTYCHTESVHIDVGPERDWNWRCRRRKA